jgi:response regulator RpfG family c-di-GMP phosphodiesterase
LNVETTTRPRILCVDDEPNVLEGLALHLRRKHDMLTAPSGQAALDILAKDKSVAVIMSDMRMPGMNGAEFLARARQISPDSVRLLLTGQAELQATIAAVNEGQIFRFLTKPCPPPMLLAAFEAAVQQHRLVTAERVLLEQTLQGSIKALVDVLALTTPLAFGRASRLKARVATLVAQLGIVEKWPIEVASMLSELPAITLPQEVLEKMYFGGELLEAEQKMLERLPEVTEQLLGSIPRLESVRAILARLGRRPTNEPLSDDPAKRTIELGARILRVVTDFDALEAQGNAPARAIDTMRGRGDRYDTHVLDAFAAQVAVAPAAQEEVRELPISALRVGMVFLQDVKLTTGVLLCGRGYEITTSFLARAQNFRPGTVKEPVRVRVPPELPAN